MGVCLLFLFLGCHWLAPTQTSTSAMAGVVLDQHGTALVGAEVFTLESSVLTDDEGRFGLYYKRPDLHVGLQRGAVSYRRVYRPDDDGKRIEIQLPKTHDLTVVCGGFDCDAELRWILDDGLVAKAHARCEPNGLPKVVGAPSGAPAFQCRHEGQVITTSARLEGERLVLRRAARKIVFELEPDGEPSACRLRVGEQEVNFGPETRLEIVDETWAQAFCDGRSGAPVLFDGTVARVAVPWSSTGPSLQAPAGIELANVRITRSDGWTLVGRASSEGAFELPPLAAGSYVVQLYEGKPVQVPTNLVPSAPEALEAQLLSSGALVFSMALSQDLVDGVLEPRMKEPR